MFITFSPWQGGCLGGASQPVASLTLPRGSGTSVLHSIKFPAPPYSLLELPQLLLLCQHSGPQDRACLTVPHQLFDFPVSLPGWREDEVWINGEEIEGSFLSHSVPGLCQLVTDSQPSLRLALPSPSPDATVRWRRRGPRARISAPTSSSKATAAAASTPLASFFMHLFIHSIVFIVH